MKRYVYAGLVSYLIYFLYAVLYALIFGQIDSNTNIKHATEFWCIVFILLLIVSSLFGMLFGMLFKKYWISWPFPNEYYNAIIWLIVIDLGFFVATKGPQILLQRDLFSSIITNTLIGLLFVKLARIFGREKNKEIAQIS